jgi:hypothetical protein
MINVTVLSFLFLCHTFLLTVVKYYDVHIKNTIRFLEPGPPKLDF